MDKKFLTIGNYIDKQTCGNISCKVIKLCIVAIADCSSPCSQCNTANTRQVSRHTGMSK